VRTSEEEFSGGDGRCDQPYAHLRDVALGVVRCENAVASRGRSSTVERPGAIRTEVGPTPTGLVGTLLFTGRRNFTAAPADLELLPAEAHPTHQCPLVELPKSLRVAGNLRLRKCRRLEQLPKDLRVGRSVFLQGCTALASLPDSLEVAGDLTILGAPNLKSLPAGLSIEGSLRLVGVRVERLPSDLRVRGDLKLEWCSRLTGLPEGLEIGGSLLIRRCPIRRLPRDLRIGLDTRR